MEALPHTHIREHVMPKEERLIDVLRLNVNTVNGIS